MFERLFARRGLSMDRMRRMAKRLCRETTVGNPWIAKRLRMGRPNYVSNLIHTGKISILCV